MSDTFATGTRTAFARAISAEIRGQLAARHLTYKQVVDGAGLSSTNYLSIRLRDDKPFTLDDLDKIASFLSDGSTDGETVAFIRRAVRNHEERIYFTATVEREDRPLRPRGSNVAQSDING